LGYDLILLMIIYAGQTIIINNENQHWLRFFFHFRCYLSIKIKDNVSEWRDMYYYMHCYLSIKIKDNVSEWRDMYYYIYMSLHSDTLSLILMLR
jgi:predicted RNA-binding protein associated with RNAse of E/G family